MLSISTLLWARIVQFVSNVKVNFKNALRVDFVAHNESGLIATDLPRGYRVGSDGYFE